MHKIFTIFHLIHEICVYMSRDELSVLARVSSVWFRCAIPLLYKNVEMRFALAPLGKMTRIPRKQWEFDNPPSDENFERFLLNYSPYVRSTTLDQRSINITLEAIKICVLKGIPRLFPNVRVVSLQFGPHSPAYIQISDHLLSSNVHQLCLKHASYPPLFYDLCALAKTRISALDSLEIEDFSKTARITAKLEPIQELLSLFASTLTSVYIPMSLDTASIVECLAKMPNLQNLSIGDQSSKTMKREMIYNSSNRRDCFSSLRSFSYDGSFQLLYNMFWKRYNLSSLTAFSWNIEMTGADVGTAILTIITSCPRLMSLVLGPRWWRKATDTTSIVSVSWSHIQPITRCKELTHLSLNGMHVSVDMTEFTDFLKSRRTWTRLDIFTADPMRLQDILVYAEHCPNLEELGVSIDTENDNVQRFVASYLENTHDDALAPFLALRRINFEYSRITRPSTSHLVKFLHRICKGVLIVDMLDYRLARYISKRLAIVYLEEEGRTGKPIPSRFRKMIVSMAKREDIICPAQQNLCHAFDS